MSARGWLTGFVVILLSATFGAVTGAAASWTPPTGAVAQSGKGGSPAILGALAWPGLPSAR